TNKVQGNPNLDPTFNHNMTIRFQDFNVDHQRSIMVMGDFQFSQNAIISKVMYNEDGTRLTTYENVNGVWNGRIMNMFSQPLRNKKWTFSNHIFVNGSRSVGYNNGVYNAALNFNISENPSIAFRPDNFEFELRPNYSLQTTHNTVQSNANQIVHRYGGNGYVTYYTPWGLTLQTDIRYTATQGYAKGYDTKTWLWNATLSQQFLRDRSLTLSVKVYDILNQRNSIRRSVSANYIDDTSYNSLTRYGMVTLSWKFNSFGKGNTPTVTGEDNFRSGGMGGPGMGRPSGGGRGPR
ncbi:MAG: outer membrane beta-barrel family protein, partial [Duncaniella sp.]|nr:outer membrane beta-barrel family protein [Duncaniella sp.]